MIKHFGIFPSTIDKNNLHDVQKSFLVYLCAVIPSMEGWTMDVSYQREKLEIEEMTIESVEFSESELDLMRIQNDNIEEKKKERLIQKKQAALDELDKRYKLKPDNEDEEELKKAQEILKRNNQGHNVLEMLQGRGIVDKNGLQN